MIRVSAHQVNFLPWRGFWHKLISADIFVACAGFPFTRHGYENRVTMRDSTVWATVPVSHTSNLSKGITIADPEALAQLGRRINHWSHQRQYRHRERLGPVIEYLQSSRESQLYKLNYTLIEIVLEILGHCDTTLVLDLSDRTTWPIERAIVDIVSPHGQIYLSGASGPRYANRDAMTGLSALLVQKLPTDVPTETVLHLIAEVEDPLGALSELGEWQPWL